MREGGGRLEGGVFQPVLVFLVSYISRPLSISGGASNAKRVTSQAGA